MGVGCRFGHLRPRGHEPVEEYVSQTGTSEARAARAFSLRNGAKLKLYDASDGLCLLSSIDVAAAAFAFRSATLVILARWDLECLLAGVVSNINGRESQDRTKLREMQMTW